MSYNEKMEAAKGSVKDYYTAVLPDRPDNMPVDVLYNRELDAVDKSVRFAESIKKLGATSEEGLALLSHEDILSVLEPVGTIWPKVLAKQIAGVFRSGEGKSGYISSRKAESMSIRELLEAYDPLESGNSVGARLKNLSGDKPCLVFNQDAKTLNVTDSLFLLEELRSGWSPRQFYNGETVYKVGEAGASVCVNENPLFPGRPLRSDDTCDVTNRSWKAVGLDTRQLARMIDLNSDYARKAGVTVNMILDIAVVEVAGVTFVATGFERLGERFPEALAKYNNLKREGKLPSLKMYLNPLTKKSTNLFTGGKKVS